MIFRRRFGSASAKDRAVRALLYGRPRDSQVTPLGVYRTNYGRKRAVK